MGAEREISARGKFGKFYGFNGISALLLSEFEDHLILLYMLPNCARSGAILDITL